MDSRTSSECCLNSTISRLLLLGLSAAAIFEKTGLPCIIGMLVVGIVINPYVLDMPDSSIPGISSVLRQVALITILISVSSRLSGKFGKLWKDTWI